MGGYCRIWGRVRANEKFSGRGHQEHVCKDCQRLPHAKRDEIERREELERFFFQSNISARNLDRLKKLREHPNDNVRQCAALILKADDIPF